MYKTLRETWAPSLYRQREGAFSLVEALDLLFRSVIRGMKPEWIHVLLRYSNDNARRANCQPMKNLLCAGYGTLG
jgi:hypothetical protein